MSAAGVAPKPPPEWARDYFANLQGEDRRGIAPAPERAGPMFGKQPTGQPLGRTGYAGPAASTILTRKTALGA